MNRVDTTHPLKRLYHSGFVCGGLAIGDVDGDDLPDLFATSGPGENRLYRQDKAFRFQDITAAAGVGGGEAWGAGAAMVDIDNDGDLDIYVCNYDSPNQLFINSGRGRFREAAAEFGLNLQDACITPAFCDYDRDGDLDVFVLTNRLYRAGGRPKRPPYSVRDGRPYVLPEYQQYYVLKHQGGSKYSIDNTGRPDRLMRNNGDGTFTEVSAQAGVTEAGHGLSVTWWDYNHDGWPDVYVGNDFNDPDHLYRNDGDGGFTDVTTDAVPHSSWFSMGADFADLNDDCRFDLLVADMAATTHYGRMTTMLVMNAEKISKVTARPPQVMKNALYVNSGGDRFFEAAELAGLANTDWTWAVKLADFDNDGRNDAFFCNGTVREFTHADHPMGAQQMIGRTEWDQYEQLPPCPQQNLAFRNAGDLRFTDVSRDWGLDKVAMSYSAAYSDLDRDGDLDLVVANLDEPISVYRNDLDGGSRLLVRLIGVDSNRFGLGATITIETALGRQIRMVSPQTGFLSSNEPVAHFGLGEADRVDRVVVEWPSGRRQEVTNVSANQLLTLTEPPAGGASEPISAPSPALEQRDQRAYYTPVTAASGLRHIESRFDDFASQPLLPRRLSRLGPGVAVADYDGDGDDDFYLGGAAGQAGRLVVNQGNRRFEVRTIDALLEHQDREDMGAIWFDLEADGDLDLFVVSGGVEGEPGSDHYGDRLYLNNGDGSLSAAPADLFPELRESGSVAAAADFDQDGDVDLFVGTRVLPGRYPTSGTSRLLENRDGRLVDATERVAPALSSCGMATGATWSDADGDGWVDLLVTTEWGPVRLYKNDQGTLFDKTDAAGLSSRTGWWNGIAARDLDGDQDIDYVVTNFGLNTRYKASPDRPALLYYGDFDGAGDKQLLEAAYADDSLFPMRNRDSFGRAIPHIPMMFRSHDEFARASLKELYTADSLRESEEFAATALESGVLINDGTGVFSFTPLPRMAQLAPAFGLVLTELNGDGVADLYLAQNFGGAAAEAGRMDGGMGMALLGNGDGGFMPVGPTASGLVTTGDATAACECVGSPQEARPLLVVGVNDGPLQAYQPSEVDSPPPGVRSARFLRLKLVGPLGNPTAYGSRVTVRSSNGATQTAEVLAGSGYLSQGTSSLLFGIPPQADATVIEVRWPDRAVSKHKVDGLPTQLIRHPQQGQGQPAE